MEDFLKEFKPEGKDYIYRFCVICDKISDGSSLMSQYGICTTCLKKILDIPSRLFPYFGRVFLLMAQKTTIVLGEDKK